VEVSSAARDADFELVHADTLRFFPELVVELGGEPERLAREAGVDLVVASDCSNLTYSDWIALLEHAASALHCPDFGLRLARRQGGGRVFGPMGVVMRNSSTFGEAIDYVAKHCHAHSLAARVRLERDPASGALFSGHEILVEGQPNKRQAVEQLMLLGHLNALEITGGRARAREVHFRRPPLSPLRTYRRYFGCDVFFDQKEDGVVYSVRDLQAPIVDRDVRLYEEATSFIESEFRRVAPPVHAQVRAVILQLIGTEPCSNERIAAELGLHTRTLHRRLKAEGKSFEEIKDEVRRDVALSYLTESDLPLALVAGKLGYAEHSVLTRSCVRWFAAAPSQVRRRARSARAAEQTAD
jgi:AraC-like DNA-binding protein